MHGLWQAPHAARGAGRAAGGGPLPDRRARHGRALGAAAQGLKKKVYTALVEGKNLRRPSCLHALSRPEIGHLRALAPGDARSASSPTASTSGRSTTCPPARRSRPSSPSWPASSSLLFFGRLHVKKGLDLLAEALGRAAPRPSRAPPAAGRQRRRGAAPVPATDRASRAVVAGDLGRPRLGRAGPAGLGRGRRLHPAQLQRRLQHGDPRGPGLPAPGR